MGFIMSNNHKICKVEGCENPAFQDLEECALHCEKNSYREDWHSGLLSEFYNILEKYIKTDNDNSDQLILRGIFFPCRDNRDSFDYFKILKRFQSIHFLNCNFYYHSMDLFPIKIFYDECCFKSEFYVYPTNILENELDSIFSMCTFENNIKIYGSNVDNENNADNSFDFYLFSDCSFLKEVSFYNCNFNNDIFHNLDNRIKIEKLRISDSVFNDKFSLNHSDIETLEIRDCKFMSKLEIKDSEINVLLFENSNVEKVSDFFESKIENFKFYKCIFNDFLGFEKVVFGTKNTEFIFDSNMALFKHVSFMSFANFRNAVFYQGLDISDSNFKETPNFYNVKVFSNNTNRETFRIIKNSFDKNGNHIEANNYFIQEMKAYKRELKKGEDNRYSEKIVIYLNEWISSFGQSYWRPIRILILSIILYNLCFYLQKYYFVSEQSKFYCLVNFANQSSKNFLPFVNFLKEKQGMEFISLLFYIWFSVLIWQIIVAIKRHTIR